MASSSVSAASVPHKKRKSSNASSDIESETGRLFNSLGSPASSLADVVGTAADTPQTTASKQPPHGGHNLEETQHVHFPAQLPHLRDHGDEESTSQNGSKGSRHLPERRLQPKKRKMSMESLDLTMLERRRKMSHESYDSAMGDSALGLATGSSMDSNLPTKQPDNASVNSKNSGGSAAQVVVDTSAPLHGISALEHLDALGDGAAELPAPTPVHELKKAPPHQDSSSRDQKPRARLKSDDDGEMKPPANKHHTQHHHQHHHQHHTTEDGVAGDGGDDNTSNETFTSSGHRLLMEAVMMTSGGGGGSAFDYSGGRKRLESWGGMSDLSFGEGNTAAAIAASALQHTGIIDDVTAAANFGAGSVDSSVTDGDHHALKPPAMGRDRKGSTTSFSDSTFPVPASLEGTELSGDLQKFVAAAVASVGDQLAELAGAVESAASGVDFDDSVSSRHYLGRPRLDSETSSIGTPIVVGPPGDDSSKAAANHQENDASSTVEAAATAAAISVDYDAVAAAVDAAQAATGALDLSAFGDHNTTSKTEAAGSVASKAKVRRKLPVHGKKRSREQMSSIVEKPDHPVSASAIHTMPPPKSTLTEAEQEAIRERARRAAGYVPPSEQPGTDETPQKKNLPPLKKRKQLTPELTKPFPHVTPRVSNVSRQPESVPSEVFSSSMLATPNATYGSYSGAVDSKSAAKGQSTQKWESMFECLLQFIEERKQEELHGATQKEKDEWQWDGNVPTTYKTKDGKALGRWINNQRSAKSNGKLKDDREQRLVNAGLKWSVLASNSWNEMLDELRDYVKEYTKDGKKWDGNVPTNYRIKAKANGKKQLTEEDKNLGRWVNRQRSLYQSGKLRKDRQLALERVGLKWSMLATTSWESMFETLAEYAEKKAKDEGKWDGNVPANYRTDDDPPRALGRWINRQRSAHVKKKLKPEYVEKLTKLGLKWSVHERRYYYDGPRDDDLVRPDGAVSSGPISTVPATIAVPAAVAEAGSTKEKEAAAAEATAESKQGDISNKVETAKGGLPQTGLEDKKTEAASPIAGSLPTSRQNVDTSKSDSTKSGQSSEESDTAKGHENAPTTKASHESSPAEGDTKQANGETNSADVAIDVSQEDNAVNLQHDSGVDPGKQTPELQSDSAVAKMPPPESDVVAKAASDSVAKDVETKKNSPGSSDQEPIAAEKSEGHKHPALEETSADPDAVVAVEASEDDSTGRVTEGQTPGATNSPPNTSIVSGANVSNPDTTKTVDTSEMAATQPTAENIQQAPSLPRRSGAAESKSTASTGEPATQPVKVDVSEEDEIKSSQAVDEAAVMKETEHGDTKDDSTLPAVANNSDKKKTSQSEDNADAGISELDQKASVAASLTAEPTETADSSDSLTVDSHKAEKEPIPSRNDADSNDISTVETEKPKTSTKPRNDHSSETGDGEKTRGSRGKNRLIKNLEIDMKIDQAQNDKKMTRSTRGSRRESGEKGTPSRAAIESRSSRRSARKVQRAS